MKGNDKKWIEKAKRKYRKQLALKREQELASQGKADPLKSPEYLYVS